jgi:hypothetical protein
VKWRCQGLDMHAKRCRRLAVDVWDYHGDPEIWGGIGNTRAGWVRVHLCARCGGNER